MRTTASYKIAREIDIDSPGCVAIGFSDTLGKNIKCARLQGGISGGTICFLNFPLFSL